jgi:hypothetical protein
VGLENDRPITAPDTINERKEIVAQENGPSEEKEEYPDQQQQPEYYKSEYPIKIPAAQTSPRTSENCESETETPRG